MSTYKQFLSDKARTDAIYELLSVMRNCSDDKAMVDIFISSIYLRMDELNSLLEWNKLERNCEEK